MIAIPLFLADPITWLIVIILLLILGYIWLWRRWRGPTNSVGINIVNLSSSPTSVACSGTTTFNLIVSAFGYSDNPTAPAFKIEIIDPDGGLNPNDYLDIYNSATGTTPITMRPIIGGRLNMWTINHPVSLFCNSSCYVEGPNASSGESRPHIFARLTLLAGSPAPYMDSNQIQLFCEDL